MRDPISFTRRGALLIVNKRSLRAIALRISEKAVNAVSRLTINDLRFTTVTLLLSIVLLLTAYGSLLTPTYAAEGTFTIGKENGLGIEVDPGDTADSLLQRTINNALIIIYSIGGIAVFIYFVWGTVDWIFAGGDKEKIGSARKKITQSLIGLVLLSLSGVIIVVVGEIVGFSPLKELKIPGLGDQITTVAPKKTP